MYNRFPTDQDLISFLTTLGYFDPTLIPLVNGYCDATVQEFESLTGRYPILAETTPSSSYYDPPGSYSRSYLYPWRGGGKFLFLDTNFTSITAVNIGVSYDNPAGAPIDMNRSLRFLPQNNVLKGLPIEAIEFLFQLWGSLGSIQVIGYRGYSTTITADLWNVILHEAAAKFVEAVVVYLNDGVTETSEADVTYRFPEDVLGPQITRWHDLYMSYVKRFTRMNWGV